MTSLLSTFTPSMMTPEALEDLFVQRHDLALKLLALIRESAHTNSKHYTLIIGPRGIGKTHLLSVIYHRARVDVSLRDRIVIAWLKEEEWGLSSFRDVLIRILKALSVEYEDKRLAAQIELLYQRPASDAESLAARLLKEYVGEKTLLLLAENLDQMFQALGDLGQRRLRAYIQETGFFSILATATTLFPSVSRRTSPFYGFFRTEQLEELDLHGAIELLRNIARLKGNLDLAGLFLTPLGRARIRAVHHLAGGNHRIYVIFSHFLTAQSLDDLVAPLMKTIDDLTPYYQSRMTDISQQQRGIVELLADRGGASPVKDISQRTFITQQTASRQLKTLLDIGYVRVTPVGRESYYELREPLMRLCLEVKKNRAEPVRLLVDFLRLWYSPIELRDRLGSLPADASWERRCLSDALNESDTTSDDPRVAACLADSKAYVGNGDWTNAVATAEELATIRGSAADWADYAHCLGHLERWEDALLAVDRSLELDGDDTKALRRKVWILSNLHRYADALPVAERAAQLNPNDFRNWDEVGDARLGLKQPKEALDAYERALTLGGGFSPMTGKARALESLERYDDALAAVDQILRNAQERRSASSWVSRARVLDKLSRYSEALNAITTAIDLEPDSVGAWHGKAIILCHLARNVDEVEAYRKLVMLLPDDASSWTNLAMALVEAKLPLEAVDASDQALKLDRKTASAWHIRGGALLEVDRFEDALESLRTAEQLGDDCPNLPVQKAQAVIANGKWADALLALREALQKQSEKVEGAFAPLILQVFRSVKNSVWSSRAVDLVALFREAHALPLLGTALVASTASTKERIIDARAWYDAWSDAGKNQIELQLALRLMSAAMQYHEKGDPKILLELPVEERRLLESVIGRPEKREQSSTGS